MSACGDADRPPRSRDAAERPEGAARKAYMYQRAAPAHVEVGARFERSARLEKRRVRQKAARRHVGVNAAALGEPDEPRELKSV